MFSTLRNALHSLFFPHPIISKPAFDRSGMSNRSSPHEIDHHSIEIPTGKNHSWACSAAGVLSDVSPNHLAFMVKCLETPDLLDFVTRMEHERGMAAVFSFAEHFDWKNWEAALS